MVYKMVAGVEGLFSASAIAVPFALNFGAAVIDDAAGAAGAAGAADAADAADADDAAVLMAAWVRWGRLGA